MAEPDKRPDSDLPPWEQAGGVRRDCEPHRGELLLHLSYAAGLMSVLSLCLIPAAITLPFALIVFFLASRDLDAMESGRMNPEGANKTRDAHKNALGAIWAGLTFLAFTVLCLIWAFLES